MSITDESENLRLLGLSAGVAPADGVPLDWSGRRVVLVPAARLSEFTLEDRDASLRWERADVETGLAQVYTATSEIFVAQMLNLDLLGAIAFDKGCYTGQEVVARAHYRGRVKRRLQRWRNESSVALSPGDAARAADGRALSVVRVAALEGGGQELLAVGNFFGTGNEPAVEAAEPATHVVVVSGPLPLPYPLPE